MAERTVDSSVISTLDKYHQYLQSNYEGGTERFFSPTGFLAKFERTVKINVEKTRQHVFARSVDEACRLMQPVVDGGEGVFDLTAEPGTGKTSVLPFRFPTKKVVVALPTPFDAWSAYNMATGDCMLRIKGLKLGRGANVVYMDSYMAADMVMSGFLEYDLLIVDECDSNRGVTKFLSEVKAPGKVLIRMSASHGRNQSGPSKSFRVTEQDDMPDVTKDKYALAEYVTKHHVGRSLLLVPDAQTAIEMGAKVPVAKVICSKSNLGDIARAVVNQQGDRLYVADDVCARGLNLNLDCVFDCQLVAENGVVRPISPAELYQRKGRVGRNRDGWYRSPGLGAKDIGVSDIDIFRNNVCRALAQFEQEGSDRLRVSSRRVDELALSAVEPYVMNQLMIRDEGSSSRQSRHSRDSSDDAASFRSYRSSRSSSTSSKVMPRGVTAPSWLFQFCNDARGTSDYSKYGKSDTYLVKSSRGLEFHRRKDSSSSGELAKSNTGKELSRRRPMNEYDRDKLPVAASAPYAAPERLGRRYEKPKVMVPVAPPVVDLTQLTYDMDWPSLIADRLAHGGDLPTLVPPNSWRHTSVGGVGKDWLQRLDDLADKEVDFSEKEFEVVCRAWNKLVALAWVRKTPGLNNNSSLEHLEFCARYFQSYFMLAAANQH